MKNKKVMPVGRQGFTLIELLVVIAIIGLLSTLAVVSLNNARSKARDARRTSDMKAMQSAIEMHIGDYELPPTLPATWAALATGPAAQNNLAAYLPAGTPKPPDTRLYGYCVNGNSYLVAAVVETNDEINGDLDGATTSYTTAQCRLSDNTQPSAVVNCNDKSGGRLNAANQSVFCLGRL